LVSLKLNLGLALVRDAVLYMTGTMRIGAVLDAYMLYQTSSHPKLPIYHLTKLGRQ
jgi:hypothetical protein